MSDIKESIDEIVYGAYQTGYCDAIPATIEMIRELGIINEKMEIALNELVYRGDKIQPKVNLKRAAEIAAQATKEIMEM